MGFLREMRKYTFHLLGLAHLPCSKEYSACAFTAKNWKLAKMLSSLGHKVFYYGAEGSDLDAEIIQTHTLSDIRQAWGEGNNYFDIGYDWKTQQFRHDFNSARTQATLKFYNRATMFILQRKKPDDFLLVTQGYYHKPIVDAVNLFLSVEPGIGYRGSFLKFRAFESSYIQNFTYGSEHPFKSINGSFYDRIIPNYFDASDFEFNNTPKDYFLYLGRLIKRKGILTAVKTCEALNKKLIIAGQGGALQNNTLMGDDFQLEPSIWEYVGFADITKRKELLANAIATFTPSEYLEPFCGVHIESMLSGTPVITTNFGVFPETIPNHLEGKIGFRCNTLQDFVTAAKQVSTLNRKFITDYASRFLMDNVKLEFQRWFDDLYRLYESTQDKTKKAWHYLQ